jgi:hypothetical protein
MYITTNPKCDGLMKIIFPLTWAGPWFNLRGLLDVIRVLGDSTMIFDTIDIMFAMICVGKLFLFLLWKEMKLYHMGFLYYYHDLKTSSYRTMMQNVHHTRVYTIIQKALHQSYIWWYQILLKGTKILQGIITLKLISSFNTSQNTIVQKPSYKKWTYYYYLGAKIP